MQLSNANPFGKIKLDQAIEETIKKDTHTAGETKRFSLKASAVAKYYITSEYLSSCVRLISDLQGQKEMREMFQKCLMMFGRTQFP